MTIAIACRWSGLAGRELCKWSMYGGWGAGPRTSAAVQDAVTTTTTMQLNDSSSSYAAMVESLSLAFVCSVRRKEI